MRSGCIFFAILSLLFSFSVHGALLPNFVHCRTPWETTRLGRYSDSQEGKRSLSADMSKFLELKLGAGFIVPLGSGPLEMGSAISGAIDTILETETGMSLFKTLVTKLSLRRETLLHMYNTLDRYRQNVQKNNLLAAAGALYRMAKGYMNSTDVSVADVNKAIRILSSPEEVKSMLDKVLITSGWEEESAKILNIPAPTKPLCAPDEEDFNLLTNKGIQLGELQPVANVSGNFDKITKLMGMYLNTTKVLVTNEEMRVGHCYYMSSDGTNIINIHIPMVSSMEVYALPSSPEKSGEVVRTFRLAGHPERTRSFDVFKLNKRVVSGIEEVLLHEVGHCLHSIENRRDVRGRSDSIVFSYNCSFPPSSGVGEEICMTTDISAEMTKDWINPEEFRNAIGIVIMSDGKMQKDVICTYNYDKERGREIRWPYRDVATSPATTASDFIGLVKLVHP